MQPGQRFGPEKSDILMTDTPRDDKLAHDTERLANAMESVLQLKFVRLHDNMIKLVWFQFLRGLAFGLGGVIGGGALVSVVVLVLSQVEFIPVIGNFATDLIEEISADADRNAMVPEK
ncbi:hypothetical protein SAMN06265370_11449 [Puniceibacterium sediminis]|uniref:Uncharacterized protein n=2 Tax=Puniceibacterium sediminis TaxID=1608407 RepID=A0A238Y308_9RHOB|nr:hypothetical protein SAMN06265370_11449 [Puniceibacterium sediminis]